MSGLTLILCTSVVAVVLATTPNVARADENAQSKAVTASDLLTKTKVIGVLGRPLGTLMTIRGTWRRIKWKDAQAVFRVTHIDGKPITGVVEFKDSSIWPIHGSGDPSIANGTSWEWKACVNGAHRPPDISRVKEGEEWEIAGAENGHFVVRLSQQFWNDLGGAWIAWPASGYHPRYTFIALRRVESKTSDRETAR